MTKRHKGSRSAVASSIGHAWVLLRKTIHKKRKESQRIENSLRPFVDKCHRYRTPHRDMNAPQITRAHRIQPAPIGYKSLGKLEDALPGLHAGSDARLGSLKWKTLAEFGRQCKG